MALALPAADQPSVERKAEAAKRFAKLKEYCQERRATLIVELLAEWGDCAGADEQAEVTKLAEALVATANEELEANGLPKGGQRLPKLKGGEVSTDTKTDSPTYFVDDFLSLGERLAITGCPIILNRQIVAAATLRAWPSNEHATESVILTNAPVAEFLGLRRCVVVSSGRIVMRDAVRGSIMSSVIVCRGNAEYLFGPRIQSGSCVRLGGLAKSLEDPRKPGGQRTEADPKFVTEKDTKFLGVKFYSTADDGLTAEASKDGVTAAKVDEKKLFGKAGVKKGDVIVSVNGERLLHNADELDRLVARATVASGVAKVKVKRDGKEETMEVKLFDWSAYKPPEKKDDPKAKPPADKK